MKLVDLTYYPNARSSELRKVLDLEIVDLTSSKGASDLPPKCCELVKQTLVVVVQPTNRFRQARQVLKKRVLNRKLSKIVQFFLPPVGEVVVWPLDLATVLPAQIVINIISFIIIFFF